jgi:hypothetical protein
MMTVQKEKYRSSPNRITLSMLGTDLINVPTVVEAVFFGLPNLVHAHNNDQIRVHSGAICTLTFENGSIICRKYAKQSHIGTLRERFPRAPEHAGGSPWNTPKSTQVPRTAQTRGLAHWHPAHKA